MPKKGFWDLPGGFVDDGESPETALRRETKEELGVTVTIKRIVGIYVDQYYFQYSFNTFNVYYECLIRSGKPKPMDDVADMQWFDRKKIPWSRLGFVTVRQGLKDWMRAIN